MRKRGGNTKFTCDHCGNSFNGDRNDNPKYCDRKCKGAALSGSNSAVWKGDNAGYSALHKWIARVKGKPAYCEECNRSDEGTPYDWANISGKYKRDVSDWKRFCRSCHQKFDNVAQKRTLTNRKNLNNCCRNGHPLTPDNTFNYRGGDLNCRTCRRVSYTKYNHKVRGKPKNAAY